MQNRRHPVSVASGSAALALALIAACTDDKPERNSSARSPSPAPPTQTAVVHVRPVDDQGRLRGDFTVTDTVDGAECDIGSVKVAELAHRCFAGSGIYDPCWTETDGPSGPSVLCMGQPWSNEVWRLLTGTDIAPDPPAPGFDAPWGVELADGRRCRYATGAHSSLNPAGDDDADVVDYHCDDSGPGLSLLRGISRTQPVWTARAARYVNGHYELVDPQAIAMAWF